MPLFGDDEDNKDEVQVAAAAAVAGDAADAGADDDFDGEEAPQEMRRIKVIVESNQDGQSVLCVRPWEGAVVPPDNAPPNDSRAPDAKLQLEWVYGYRSQGVRANLAIDSTGRVIYPAAAVVVAFDTQQQTQEHFLGHNDDITCLAQHPTRADVIATGQVASIVDGHSANPYICVYDWSSKQCWQLPALHQRRVCALAFSADGKYLASAGTFDSCIVGEYTGYDNDYTIIVWDWETKAAIGSTKALNKTEVTHMCWSSKPELHEFCAVGPKCVGFYSLGDDGHSITTKQGKFGQAERVNFLSVAYSDRGTACVAAETGDIYAFVGDTCSKVFAKVFPGPISCLIRHSPGLLMGGAESLKFVDSKMQTVADVKIGKGRARALCVGANGDLVVGTSLSEIQRFEGFAANNAAHGSVIVQAHHDGELWGMDVSPSGAEVVTVGEDNKLMVWDSTNHQLLRSGPVSTQPIAGGVRRKDRRAASSTMEVQERCGRSVSFSPDGRHIAVGLNSGCVSIYDARTLQLLLTRDLNSFGKVNNKIPENWISDLKYSPDGRVLAVATHGSVIVLLDVANKYTPKEKLKAHNSPVVHIDWSTDSQHLQSSCMGYELLFHNITADIVGSAQNTRASALKNVTWASQSLPFGWSVAGLVDGGVAGDFYNCVARSNASDLIATGDDNGLVKLYRFPIAQEINQANVAKGHSSHVMNVRFSHDDQFVFTAGGADKAVMQWRVLRGDDAGGSAAVSASKVGGAADFEI